CHGRFHTALFRLAEAATEGPARTFDTRGNTGPAFQPQIRPEPAGQIHQPVERVPERLRKAFARPCVEDADERDGLTAGTQLLGHLVRDASPVRIAGKIVGTARL